MKISFRVDAVLVACKEKVGQKDPSKKYYSVSIEDNDEAGAVSCVEEVFKDVQSGLLKKYQKYTFLGEINTEYNSVSIKSVIPFEKK
mgnify:CR=1 FL=1